MKLRKLRKVLFDEFPTDASVEYCFFTQPKYPENDYSQYSDKVTYCGSKTTLLVMASFTKLSLKYSCVLTERRKKFKYSTIKSFNVRALSTGCSGANPVMLLIEIDDAIYMYTGPFSQCRNVILNPLISINFDRINDIYVDNTAAGLRVPNLLKQACAQIKQIVSDYLGYTIFLHIELFGYEDLLYELARNKIKIQLCKVQKHLFKYGGVEEVFNYDGDPQIKVWVRLKDEVPLKQHHYEKLFETNKIIHVKPIVCQHEFQRREKIKGLILIPYTPHANAFELNNLFQTVKPKRIHPLIQPSYADDQMSAIQMDLLNDDCEIVDDDNFSVNFPENEHEDSYHSFFDQSQNSISGGMSTEISGPIINDLSFDDEQLSEESLHQNQDKNSQSNRQTKQTDDEIIEIISWDDDENDNDDRYDMDFNSHDQNGANPEPFLKPVDKMDVVETNEQITNSKENETKKSSECSVQTTTPNRRPMRPANGGSKRKSMKRLNPIQRNQPIQYLSSSDEDSTDVNKNKRSKLNQKETRNSSTQSGVKANVQRLSQVDNILQTNSSRQHETTSKDSHSNCQKFIESNNYKDNGKTTFNAAKQNTSEIYSGNRNDQVQSHSQRQHSVISDGDDDSSGPELLIFPD